MKAIVIGANGQLGWEVCHRGAKQGFEIVALDIPEFDITDSYAVEKAVSRSGISLVINASAYTAVDKAESEPELAFAVNRDGPAYLASSCAKIGLPLIHISTDYVFDGNKQDPYLETDPTSPLGVYGKSKAAGEKQVSDILKTHVILRTAWLYGIHGNNFVKTMLRLGKEKEVVRVVADQYGCPTYAADLADAVIAIATHIRENRDVVWGTYHYCGRGVTTWYGFTEVIFGLAKQYDSLMVKKIVPITTEEYPTPAKRPANSVMDCSLLTQNFNINLRPWQESLADMISSLFSQINHHA
ncbi:MAG: dTDP-4-dehydrorhamnose reductase [Thermodesulfobacteriota bacterium]